MTLKAGTQFGAYTVVSQLGEGGMGEVYRARDARLGRDVAEANGLPYMATELIEGETLRERLVRGPVPQAEVLDIAVQPAEGLAHAHDARIVHRDLKPNNLMLKPDGLVKIVDFGLGKLLAPISFDGGAASTASTLSEAHTTKGTGGEVWEATVSNRNTVTAAGDYYRFSWSHSPNDHLGNHPGPDPNPPYENKQSKGDVSQLVQPGDDPHIIIG